MILNIKKITKIIMLSIIVLLICGCSKKQLYLKTIDNSDFKYERAVYNADIVIKDVEINGEKVDIPIRAIYDFTNDKYANVFFAKIDEQKGKYGAYAIYSNVQIDERNTREYDMKRISHEYIVDALKYNYTPNADNLYNYQYYKEPHNETRGTFSEDNIYFIADGITYEHEKHEWFRKNGINEVLVDPNTNKIYKLSGESVEDDAQLDLSKYEIVDMKETKEPYIFDNTITNKIFPITLEHFYGVYTSGSYKLNFSNICATLTYFSTNGEFYAKYRYALSENGVDTFGKKKYLLEFYDDYLCTKSNISDDLREKNLKYEVLTDSLGFPRYIQEINGDLNAKRFQQMYE